MAAEHTTAATATMKVSVEARVATAERQLKELADKVSQEWPKVLARISEFGGIRATSDISATRWFKLLTEADLSQG